MVQSGMRNPEPVILILSDGDDWSASAVAAELGRQDVRHYWLDTADFPLRMSVAARIDRAGPDQWHGVVRVDGVGVPLEQVTAVFYWRPGNFELPAGLSNAERRFAGAQARIGLGGVLASLDARWINHPSALADSEYKPRQLSLAAQVGLAVPTTLVTNRSDEARAFVAEHRDVVIKPLAQPVVQEGNGRTTVYTRRLAAPDLDTAPGLETTAHYLQAWVPKAYDARAIAIGRRLFVVAIHASSETSRVDWRRDYDALRYEHATCPRDITDGIFRYMKRSDLYYAAFDFVVRPDGKWIFLECNAAGQWGWLAEQCDLPVAAAIVDELRAVAA